NGNGSFSAIVYGDDLEKAEKLGKIVSDYLLSQKPLVADGTYPHTLSIVDTTTKSTIVSDIDARQKNNKSLYDGYIAEQTNLQKQIDELVMPEEVVTQNGINLKSVLVSTIKWLVIGAFVGAILVCAWVFVVMLFKTRIESSRQMEQMLAVPFLGSVAKKGDFWNRLANALLNERVWDDETSGTAYISENLKTVLDKETEVLVASTLKTKGIDEDIAVVSKSASSLCKKVYAISNAEKNPEMIVALTTCKYMILAERVGKSELTEMQAVIEMAKRKGVEVIGFISL
ncbi:MAG: hypothetical protein IJC83_04785, partial [Oscillospiraceae bacterium]|nr:hypothetical protein [Oscillospiraceae bacterium]